MISKRLLLPCVLLLVLLSPKTAVVAQENAPGLTLAASAGYDGFYKTGQWFPLTVTAANDGPPINGYYEVSVRFGTELVPFRQAVELPTQSRKRTTFLLPEGRPGGFTVTLHDKGGEVVGQADTAATVPLDPAASRLVAVISPVPGLLDDLTRARVTTAQSFNAYMSVDELPQDPNGWRPLDVLVFADSDSSQLTTGQRAALETWLRSGGQLIVAGGPGWQKTTAAFADILPVTPLELTSEANLPGLQEAIPVDFRDPGPYLVTASTLRDGEALIHENGLPLLAARRHGRGSVVFLAFDPALPPFVDWDGALPLWQLIADQGPERPFWTRGIVLPGNARQAVSRIASLTLPSTGSIFLFLLLYVAAIGPANYLVLRRLGRRELAWLTTPAIILAFVVVAFFTGQRSLGFAPIVNEKSVVYGDVTAERLPADSIVTFFAPRRGRFNLIADDQTQLAPYSLLTRFNADRAITAAYYDPNLRLEGIQADIGDTVAFVGQSYRPPPALLTTARLYNEPGDSSPLLSMTVENRSNLALEDVALVAGDLYRLLDDIGPGATVTWSGAIAGQGTVSPGWASMDTVLRTSGMHGLAQALVGGSYRYDDAQSYGRFLFAQGIIGETPVIVRRSPEKLTAVTLVAWSKAPVLDLSRDDGRLIREGETLYFLDVPLQNELGPTGDAGYTPGTP